MIITFGLFGLLHSNLVASFLTPWASKWDTLPESFNWTDIAPERKLRYVPCYEGLECARYLVPLDWTNLGLERWKEVVLAVARLPAKVDRSDPSFGGTIVINPGGPSGSGVDLLRWAGRGIQQIVDGDKRFEILAFDPRGTKYSTPSSACFARDADRLAFAMQVEDTGTVDDGAYSLNAKWALSQGLGALCDLSPQGILPDGSSIRQYLSTKQVVYDMVKLTDAIEEELKYSLTRTTVTVATQRILANSGPPVLNYWGLSYGSYLGNTYASIFPGRIGRMVLDGIVDAPDYTATGWTTNLQDNDLVWGFFYRWCYEAGEACALYDGDTRSPEDIQAKLERFIAYLDQNPLPIVYNDKVLFFTYATLRGQMHLASYIPYQLWPLLAVGLQQLITATGSGALRLEHNSRVPHFSTYNVLDPFNNGSGPSMPGYDRSLEAGISILCGDGDDINFDTKPDFLFYLASLNNQSSLIGPIWAQITLICRHWPASQRPVERNRFTGPFTSNLSDYQRDGRSSPLLFIGNVADPVTPVRNAVKMSSLHEGSSVLIQNSPGHCSGVTVPSTCMWDNVKRFFNDGVLPKNGTICDVDFKPWDDFGGEWLVGKRFGML